MGGTSPNVAGRCWADEGLESVRNAEKAPEPKGWFLLGTRVAAHHRENAEGEETAREEAAGWESGSGARAVRLWRGAKGQERKPRKREFTGHSGDTKTSRATAGAEGLEGLRRTNRVASFAEKL